MSKDNGRFEKDNQAATKHGAYGLLKRFETGLTTKDDYKRYVALLGKWGLTPGDVEGMGMLGSVIEAKAWEGLIAKDAVGGYLYWKENHPDDLETIIRLGRNASYQIDKFTKDLLEVHERLQADDGAIEAAIASIQKGRNGDD